MSINEPTSAPALAAGDLRGRLQALATVLRKTAAHWQADVGIVDDRPDAVKSWADDIEAVLALVLDAAPAPAGVFQAASGHHRCAGCGLRWDDLPGAELCGDCWRKAQTGAVSPGGPAPRA